MAGYIYFIKNIINNKHYIGQTSRTIKERISEHLGYLEKGKHTNKHLQAAFNLYGKGNFIYGEIEEVEAEQLSLKEVYWIDSFNSFREGYNGTLGGESGWIGKGRETYELDMVGTLIANKYISLVEAAKDLHVTMSAIQQTCSKNSRGDYRYYVYGKSFIYKEDFGKIDFSKLVDDPALTIDGKFVALNHEFKIIGHFKNSRIAIEDLDLTVDELKALVDLNDQAVYNKTLFHMYNNRFIVLSKGAYEFFFNSFFE